MGHATHNTAQSILCVGLSHQTAPVGLRERVARLSVAWHDAAVGSTRRVREAVTLSTCNRFEVYLVGDDDLESMGQHALNAMQQCAGISPADLGEYFYLLTGDTAIGHLYRVSAGLDSQVLGESEILGQVSEDFAYGVQTRSAGPVLKALFQGAIRAGKRARSETQIGRNAGSISTLAVSMAESMLGDLRSANVVVVGAGAMGTQILKALAARKVPSVAVVNRTYRRALAHAEPMNWRACGLEGMGDALASADVIFSATAATGILLSANTVREAVARRHTSAVITHAFSENRQAPSDGMRGAAAGDGHSLLIFDIAVPRDVDPAVTSVPGVELIDLDRLRQRLDASMEARRREIPKVEAIVDQEMTNLAVQLREIDVRRTVVELRMRAEQVRRVEVQRTLRALGEANPALAERIEHLTRALVNKLLHDPTVYLKQMAQEGEAAAAAAVVRELFRLPDSFEPTTQELAAGSKNGDLD